MHMVVVAIAVIVVAGALFDLSFPLIGAGIGAVALSSPGRKRTAMARQDMARGCSRSSLSSRRSRSCGSSRQPSSRRLHQTRRVSEWQT